jgi:hypothetical protein
MEVFGRSLGIVVCIVLVAKHGMEDGHAAVREKHLCGGRMHVML